MSANGRFLLEIKSSAKQLLQRRQILNDHLQKFDMKNLV